MFDLPNAASMPQTQPILILCGVVIKSFEISLRFIILQMCLLEKVAGLQAAVLTERDDCPDSEDITVGVTLERGAPVLLLFSLTGDNRSYSETREMNASKNIFHIGHPIKGMEDRSKTGATCSKTPL